MKIKESTFIYLAIIGQLFASMNLSFTNTYLEKTMRMPDVFYTGNNLIFTYWLLLTVLGRICGAYFFGKHADRVGFFKSILSISRSFVLISAFCAALCLAHDFSYEVSFGLYLSRFIYCLLEPAALILPSLYLLKRSSHLNHYKLSGLLISAVFVAKSSSFHLIHLPLVLMKFWYLIPLITTSLSWMIYRHLESQSEPETVPLQNSEPMPFHKKTLSALFGASCGAGTFYHHFFVSYYSVNINIVYSHFELDSSIYFAICGLFLFPAAKICEKYGIYKTITISLGMLFLLGLNAILLKPTSSMYLVQQLSFSIFSAFLIVPTFVVLYRLYMSHPSFSDVMFWFILGFSFCTLFVYCEKQLVLQNEFFCFHWLLYIACFFLWLFAFYRVRSSIILDERSQLDSASCIKLVEA